MGRMNTDPCERFRGLIALEVVGRISAVERVALTAHTEGCDSCREERRELSRLPGALAAADPGHLDEQEVPRSLRSAVLDRLAAEGRRERRRGRRARVLVGSAAAAVVAAAVAVPLAWPGGPAVRTVALAGEPGVVASVRLVSEPWGTSMDLHESGQPRGEVLSVATEAAAGTWWQTGTYRTTGSSVRVTMACALKLSAISKVWVRDAAGRVVLRGAVGGYDGTGGS